MYFYAKCDSCFIDKMTVIHIPEKVTSSVLDFLIESTSASYRNNRSIFNNVFLDFSKVKYIDIEGALSIICFCAAVKRKNSTANFGYIYPDDSVLSYLITLGFFGQMSNRVGVIEGQDIVHIENERRMRQKAKSNKFDSKSVVLPIETIPKKMNTTSGADFENMVGEFANHAIDVFDILQTSPFYNFSGDDYYLFRQSNIELFKNIFDHSNSWGIASIHARPNYGTTVCYYDIGVGFKASIKKFDTEAESIEWALVDGNTSMSNDDNDGYGLIIVEEFVFSRNGNIKIRSGDCEMQLISLSSRKKTKVSSFPGAQISFFIPV